MRFFLAHMLPAGQVTLGDQAVLKHLRVLRVQEGAEFELLDGLGRVQRARALSWQSQGLLLHVEPPVWANEPWPPIVLVQCLLKGSKLESVVRMCTEAGVSEIHFATSERTVPQPSPSAWATRQQRLEKIAEQASRQSQRVLCPKLLPPRPLTAVGATAPQEALRLVCWEQGSPGAWPQRLPAAVGHACWLVVGPEGGLTSTEVETLGQGGFASLRLHLPILRSETAAAVVVALAAQELACQASSLGRVSTLE